MQLDMVSVIVPVYKVEKYLNRCIESLVKQTYENLEIILIDDGSPDRCPEICDEWAEKDTRIKVLHKKNMGVYLARQSGIECANGKYVTFVDSDDWIDNDYVEYMFNLLIKNNADIVGVGSYYCSEWDEFDDSAYENMSEELLVYDNTNAIVNNILKYNSVWGKLFKTALFDNVPVLEENYSLCEDTLLLYFLSKACTKQIQSNICKYYYFRNANSVMQGQIKESMVEDAVGAYNLLESISEKNCDVKVVSNNILYKRLLDMLFMLNSNIKNRIDVKNNILMADIKSTFKKMKSIDGLDIINKKQIMGLYLLFTSKYLYKKMIMLRKRVRGY